MKIGIGLDPTLGLSFAEQTGVSREAAELGYTSIWTPEGNGHDSVQVCLQRWAATRDAVPGGVATGIAVCPVTNRSPLGFAMSAGTASDITGGRFILGLGSGGLQTPAARRSLGLPDVSTLQVMREHLVATRGLLAGEPVTLEGQLVTLRGIRLAIRPAPRTPVYLAALGPAMLRLAGEAADGVCLNWCTPEQVAWSRERVAEGAAAAARDASSIPVVEYIRVAVDDDVDVARRALARALVPYALDDHVPTARERTLGYRAHFERMGFTGALADLDRMRSAGAPAAEVTDAFPAELMRRVGYFGRPDGAAEAFKRLAAGLDTAIVRVVPSRPGIDTTLAVMRACRPALAG